MLRHYTTATCAQCFTCKPYHALTAFANESNEKALLRGEDARANGERNQMDRLTIFGLFAVTAMLVIYALESRSRWFVLAFAGSCVLGSVYGFLQGAWPFGLVEAVWSSSPFAAGGKPESRIEKSPSVNLPRTASANLISSRSGFAFLRLVAQFRDAPFEFARDLLRVRALGKLHGLADVHADAAGTVEAGCPLRGFRRRRRCAAARREASDCWRAGRCPRETAAIFRPASGRLREIPERSSRDRPGLRQIENFRGSRNSSAAETH